jgi:5-oxoprolinase (ATP-hydrolysing) subunit A
MTIDLNSDLGEDGDHDEEILALVSSANISCGFHAGTAVSIFDSISAAKRHGVAIGAHPSFDDRKNFGRTEMKNSSADIFSLVVYQLGAFNALCRAAEVAMHHVKPHGALYNMAARDATLAAAIARAVSVFNRELILFAPPQSALEIAARELKLRTAAEFFADRNYNVDGSLVSRTRPNALLHDPEEAAERVLRILREKKVRAIDGADVPLSAETICVHGDTPGAVEFLRQLRARLERENIRVAAPAF